MTRLQARDHCPAISLGQAFGVCRPFLPGAPLPTQPLAWQCCSYLERLSPRPCLPPAASDPSPKLFRRSAVSASL